MLARFFGLSKLLGPLLGMFVATAALAAPAQPSILVLGDSLSAGYGLTAQQGWVNLLRERLAKQGYPHRVVNASISGDTTTGGLSRLPAALRTHEPSMVLIELGGNDGLRALPVKQMQANLVQMAGLSRKAGAVPVLFEMRIPLNYGPTYTQAFEGAFAAAAKDGQAKLVPFFLSGLVGDFANNFQEDGIHPNAGSQARMLDAVWPTLLPLLGKPAGATPAKPKMPGKVLGAAVRPAAVAQ